MLERTSEHEIPTSVLFAVSDATGEIARHALQVALTQFPNARVEIQTLSEVRTPAQVEAVATEAAKINAVIAHTLVVGDNRRRMEEYARQHGVRVVQVRPSAKAAGDVVLGSAVAGVGENLLTRPVLDQIT